MMKKKIILFSSGLIMILLFMLVNNHYYSSKIIIESTSGTRNDIIKTDGLLTMMYETSSGSGEYQVSSDTSWPQEGYIFNERLSGCENGSVLTWDDENKRVLLQTNTSDKCYVYFDKYTNVEITNVTASNITSDSITINVSASGGSNSISRYYYSKNNGSSYVSSTSSSYTFSGLSAGTTYNFKVYVKDTAGYSSSTKSISATTLNLTMVADICSNGDNLANCISEFNDLVGDGIDGIYHHTSSLANSAADNSYRYAGANPNNYVCFGSDAATCPSDNLYRIIGVFGSEVKLIKSTSYGNYAWDSNYSNTWSSSTIRSTLNTTYYNTLSATWQNKIATHTWKVGGMEEKTEYTAKQYYDVEVGSSSSSTTDSMKIGLMYVSDYGFAASPDYWTTALYDYDSAKSTNWLYLGSTEWTVSRTSSETYGAFIVHSLGYVLGNDALVTDSNAVRPSFYLSSSTTYVSGSGSSADPFRIT